MIPNEKETTSDDHLVVRLLGSRYAAVHMVTITVTDRYTNANLGSYPDVQQTGIGRYKTYAEAYKEALHWSIADKIPLQASPPT